MTDEEIVELFWQRDESAVEAAAAKYGAYCRSIAKNILHDPQAEEESVNDAWLHAWSSMPPHRPERLAPYLGKLTRYICLNKWRDRRTQKRGGGEAALAFEELSESVPGGGSVDDTLRAEELAGLLDAFLSELPETERNVFLRRYWYLDSIERIGIRFGFGPSKVKTMLWRTRKKLREQLEREGAFDEG